METNSLAFVKSVSQATKGGQLNWIHLPNQIKTFRTSIGGLKRADLMYELKDSALGRVVRLTIATDNQPILIEVDTNTLARNDATDTDWQLYSALHELYEDIIKPPANPEADKILADLRQQLDQTTR